MTKYVRSAGRLLPLLIVPLLTTGLGCSGRGLVRDAYSPDFYKIPRLLPDNTLDKNPRFIIYGDSRPRWRGKQVMAKKHTYLTWKQLYLPGLYQLCFFG